MACRVTPLKRAASDWDIQLDKSIFFMSFNLVDNVNLFWYASHVSELGLILSIKALYST